MLDVEYMLSFFKRYTQKDQMMTTNFFGQLHEMTNEQIDEQMKALEKEKQKRGLAQYTEKQIESAFGVITEQFVAHGQFEAGNDQQAEERFKLVTLKQLALLGLETAKQLPKSFQPHTRADRRESGIDQEERMQRYAEIDRASKAAADAKDPVNKPIHIQNT